METARSAQAFFLQYAVSGGAGRDTIAAGFGSDFVDEGEEFDTCSVAHDGTDTVLSCNP